MVKIVPILNSLIPKNRKHSRSFFFGSRELTCLVHKKFGRDNDPLKRSLKGTFVGRGGLRYAFCFDIHQYWDHRIQTLSSITLPYRIETSQLIKTWGVYPDRVWKSLSKRQGFVFYCLRILWTSMLFSSYFSRWVGKNIWETFQIGAGIKPLVPNKLSAHLSSMLRVWVKLRRSCWVSETHILHCTVSQWPSKILVIALKKKKGKHQPYSYHYG